jgi:hypothetical protein
MPRDQFFVVLHNDEWKIKHGDEHSEPFATQAEAIETAVKQAKARENSQVLVQGEDLLFRTEWTYGDDPYPPEG